MKIRNGFVSNSSSSSFIITNVNKDVLLTDIKKMLVRYRKKRIKDIIKYYDECYTNYTPEKREELKQDALNRVEAYYSDEWIDKFVHTDYLTEEVINGLDLAYWHAGYTLDYSEDVCLYDDTDNYIPEEVAEKILKKYDVRSYNLHMG